MGACSSSPKAVAVVPPAEPATPDATDRIIRTKMRNVRDARLAAESKRLGAKVASVSVSDVAVTILDVNPSASLPTIARNYSPNVSPFPPLTEAQRAACAAPAS